MVLACVLIHCEPGKSKEAIDKVTKEDVVKSAFSAFGRWDIIANLEADDVDEITRTALRINGLEGITTTETLLEVSVEAK